MSFRLSLSFPPPPHHFTMLHSSRSGEAAPPAAQRLTFAAINLPPSRLHALQSPDKQCLLLAAAAPLGSTRRAPATSYQAAQRQMPAASRCAMLWGPKL